MDISQQSQRPVGVAGSAAGKIKEVLIQFLAAVDAIKREHRAKINETLKDVDERKIKALKEKLKNL